MSDKETPEPRNIPPKFSVPASNAKAGSEQAKNADKPEEKADVAASDSGTRAADVKKAQPDQPAGSGEQPTVILQKNPASGDPKRKTSRISLDSALTSRLDDALGEQSDDAGGGGKAGAAAEDGGPKTIRLTRPPSAGAQGKPSGEGAPDQDAPKTIRLKRPSPASPSSGSQDSKSKTSRISLDKVLQSGGATDESASGGATGIKTIRLRKPGQDTGTGIAPAAASDDASKAEPEGGEAASEQEAKSRTSRLDVPESQDQVEDAVPSTQRKTIRIKRPDAQGGARPGRTLTLARDKKASAVPPAEAPETGAEAETVAERDRVREPGALFAVATIAAMVVAALLVYMLVVQAFPDAGLSWFGQFN